MSQMVMHKLACLECGHEHEAAVWNSVNVSLDPELRQKLFDAEINLFKCVSCGKTAFINVPLLYHDMKRQYCVQYYPPLAIDDEAFLQQFTRDAKLDMTKFPGGMFERTNYLAAPQIVFDMNDMVRYIEFRDRLFEAHGGKATKP
jgi:hypothetical protein